MRLYVDGKAQNTLTGQSLATFQAQTGTQGNHTVAIVAWDTTGHVFSATRTINSAFQWGWLDCPTKGTGPCTPGFDTTPTPLPSAYVDSTFDLKADVKSNPNPITAVRAYIDGKAVATSSGPTIMAKVENAPTGTHILTLQAWDTQGKIYRVQYNININVPH
jgi:hypothetical protein